MIYIYKQAEVSISKDAYILLNKKNNTALSCLMTTEDLSILNDLIPCKEIETLPSGYKMMPRAMEEEFFDQL